MDKLKARAQKDWSCLQSKILAAAHRGCDGIADLMTAIKRVYKRINILERKALGSSVSLSCHRDH